MIGTDQISKIKSPFSNFIEPYYSKRRPKNLYAHQLAQIKHLNGTFRQTFRSKEIAREQERKTMSMRELSIDQIKTKIKQYLGNNGDTEILNVFSHQLINDHYHRSTHQQFRVSMFKNNAKKKINLKILQSLNPERYQSKNNDFSIREACINKRVVMTGHDQADLLANKNGIKNRFMDFKIQRRKRVKNSFSESTSRGLERKDSFRAKTPKAWQSSMQPWKKWQQVESFQGSPLY